MAVLIYILTISVQWFPFFYILTSIYYLCIFDNGHSNKCEVIFHCNFDLHFPDDSNTFIGKNVYSGPLLIFKCDYYYYFFAIELYHFKIYFIYLPSISSLIAIFSPISNVAFTWMIITFAVQEPFI